VLNGRLQESQKNQLTALLGTVGGKGLVLVLSQNGHVGHDATAARYHAQ